MIVKICGITRVEDAAAAVALGASARSGSCSGRAARASSIRIGPARSSRQLPPFVTTVGVFVNQPVGYVNGVAALVGLGVVQLHGDEDPAYCRGRDSGRCIKAVSLPAETRVDGARGRRATMLLVDAHDPVRRGGTGTTVDWGWRRRLARRRRRSSWRAA